MYTRAKTLASDIHFIQLKLIFQGCALEELGCHRRLTFAFRTLSSTESVKEERERGHTVYRECYTLK